MTTTTLAKQVVLFVACTLFSNTFNAQQNHSLGALSKLKGQLNLATPSNNIHNEVSLTLDNSVQSTLHINTNRFVNNEQHVVGVLTSLEGKKASFDLRIGSKIEGHVLQISNKKAWDIKEENGKIMLKPTSVDHIICTNNEQPLEHVKENSTEDNNKPSVDALNLESYPGAKGCLYLDFDGELISGTSWKDGSTFNVGKADLSDAEITEIFNIVKEDFLPFNLNVTTSRAVFNSYPERYRQLAVVTDEKPFNSYGIAYVSSFDDDNPCFIMTYNRPARRIAATCSHELGHALGLYHDKFIRPDGSTDSYYDGHTNWGSIMGSTYKHVLGQFSKCEYKSAENAYQSSRPDNYITNSEGKKVQDDLYVITSHRNDVGYRPDDHSEANPQATPLVIEANGNVLDDKNNGIIEKNTDRDAFYFSTSGGDIDVLISPAAVHPNLDIGATLYDLWGNKIADYDSTGVIDPDYVNGNSYLHVRIQENLNAGTYYLKVYGVGANDPYIDGYSNYASLGYYSISGNIPNSPITNVQEQEISIKLLQNNNSVKLITQHTKLQRVTLLSSDGKLIKEIPNYTNSQPIELSSLSQGVYYINIQHQGASHILRFLK